MKQNGNMSESDDNFRKIGSKIDCKYKNGKWYSAEIKLYLNCKQTAILIHYLNPINNKYCDDEWIFIESDTICNCYGKCIKSHHRLAKENTQTRYKSHHIESSLSKQIEASIDNKQNKMRNLSSISPSNSITKTVTLKCGKDNRSIMLEYEDKSAKISLDCVDKNNSGKSMDLKSLGVFYNEIRKTLIGFGLEQFHYKLPDTYRWINGKTRQIMGPNTKLENLGNDEYELRLKRSP